MFPSLRALTEGDFSFDVRFWHTVDELTEMKVRSEREADVSSF